MGLNLSERKKKYEELIKLLDHKEKHLNEYRAFIADLIETDDGRIFYQGKCEQCNQIDQKIKELEAELAQE